MPHEKSVEGALKAFWYSTVPLADVTLRSSQLFVSLPPVRKPMVPVVNEEPTVVTSTCTPSR